MNDPVKKQSVLILGLGNEILSDDGIGPRLVRALSGIIRNEHILFESAGCGGLEIMEHIRGFKTVIIIDAIRSSGGRPGDVYHFLPDNFHETSNLSNLHDVSFLTTLRLGDILGLDLPHEIHIIAVEIVEDREFGEEFTPEIKERFQEIFDDVVAIVKRIT